VGWLKDPRFDLALIGGATAVGCAFGGAVALVPALFLPLVTFETWCFSFDHVAATFTRLLALPSDRRRHRFLIWGLPPLALAAVLALGQASLGALNTAYFLFQWFHTTRQSWGIAERYRRAGSLRADRFREATLWALPLTGMLARCHQQPEKFFWMRLYLPRAPGLLVWSFGAAAALLVLRFFWQRRRALFLPHTLYLTSHFLVFSLGYLVLDLSSGWLLVNVWHNLQYLLFVWLHHHRRFSSGVHPKARLLSWLSQAGRAPLYLLACLAVSTPIFWALYYTGDRLDSLFAGRLVSIPLVTAMAINLHHYIVDGLIWRRANPS
jgi:hypothetical protein